MDYFSECGGIDRHRNLAKYRVLNRYKVGQKPEPEPKLRVCDEIIKCAVCGAKIYKSMTPCLSCVCEGHEVLLLKCDGTAVVQPEKCIPCMYFRPRCYYIVREK